MRKRVLIPIIILVTLIFFSILPLLINSYVNRTIDVKQFKLSLVETLNSMTGLRFSIEGAYVNFPYGVIFTGVKLYSPADDDLPRKLFQTENLLLEFSLLRLIKEGRPFVALQATAATLYPADLSLSEWSAALKNISTYIEENPDFPAPAGSEMAIPLRDTQSGDFPFWLALLQDPFRQIEIRLPALALVLPEELAYITDESTDATLQQSMELDFTASPQSHSYQINLYLKPKQEKGSWIRVNGNWHSDKQRKLLIKYDQIPIEFMAKLAGYFPMLPTEMKMLGQLIAIQRGKSSGKGSLDVLENEIGLNLDGNCQQLDYSLGVNDANQLSISNSQAQYNLNFVTRDFSDGPAQIKFEYGQTDLSFNFLYNNYLEGKHRKQNFEFNTSLNFQTPGSIATDDTSQTNSSVSGRLFNQTILGNLNFAIGYDYHHKKKIEPRLSLSSEGLSILLNEEIYKPSDSDPNESPQLKIEKLKLTQKPGKPLRFASHGNFLRAPFEFSGKSKSSFLLNQLARKPLIVLHQQLEAELLIKGLEYRRAIIPISRIQPAVVSSAIKPNAPKAEDIGPIRRYRFIPTRLQRALLDDTNFKLRIQLKELKGGGNTLPEELELLAAKNQRNLQIALKPVRTSDHSIDFKYNILFQETIPAHILNFSVNLKNNQLHFPELLGNATVPRSINMEYSMSGQGWLPYDLTNNTYSKLVVELNHANLTQLTPVRIARHRLKLEDSDFEVEQFKFWRYTNGGDYNYANITLRSPTLTALGSGTYNPVRGGEINFRYSHNKSKYQNFKLHLLDNNRWSPGD